MIIQITQQTQLSTQIEALQQLGAAACFGKRPAATDINGRDLKTPKLRAMQDAVKMTAQDKMELLFYKTVANGQVKPSFDEVWQALRKVDGLPACMDEEKIKSSMELAWFKMPADADIQTKAAFLVDALEQTLFRCHL